MSSTFPEKKLNCCSPTEESYLVSSTASCFHKILNVRRKRAQLVYYIFRHLFSLPRLLLKDTLRENVELVRCIFCFPIIDTNERSNNRTRRVYVVRKSYPTFFHSSISQTVSAYVRTIHENE